MLRFRNAKLTPESESFLKEEAYRSDNSFPQDWHSSAWNRLSAEGRGKLAGYELNQLKNATLAYDKFASLSKVSIHSFSFTEETMKRLEEAGYTHLHHLPYCTDDSWWSKESTYELIKGGELEELKKFLNELGDNSSSEKFEPAVESSGVAPDLFNEYCNKGNGLDDLLQLIFKEADLHRHYIVFTQSSGYGKTRLMMHLLREKYAGVMLLCDNISGGFRKSDEIVKLVRDFDKETDDCEKTLVVTRFLRRMCLYIECYHRNREELFRNQFDEQAGKYKATFADPNDAFNKESPEKRSSADVARKADSDSGKRHVTFDESTMKHPEPMTMKEWIIVFDEAQCLSEELLARLKVVLDQFGVVGIFVSTCGHLATLLPKAVSSRTTQRKVMPPVHVLRTFDLHNDGHRLYLGRPLWKLQCETRCDGDFKALVWYAVSRLCDVNSQHALHMQSTLLSLFMVRFGGIKPIDSIAGSTFVTHHMATYTKLEVAVEKRNRTIATEVTYPSEPILAEASAFCTSIIAGRLTKTPHFTKVDVIQAVATCVRSATLVQLDKGDIGEMMACALIGYQLDLIREDALRAPNDYNPCDIKYSMAAPVSVADFLLALYSGAQDCVDDLPELRNYSLNVNHFVRLQYPCRYSTCAEVIKRGAAVVTYECSPGLDFFMEATRPWNDAAVEDATEDLDMLALHDSTLPETGLTLQPTTFQGLPLYKTAKGAVVFFQDGKKRYLGKRQAESAKGPPKPPTPRCSSSNNPSHHNIHVRVSVKNYVGDISSKAAEVMLDNLNTACEPVGAVAGGGKETILVNILINMGSGLLVPSISVATPRTTRSGDASYSKAVRLAVGLNHGELEDGNSCFKHFPDELLDAFRKVTKAECDRDEDYWAMRYGGDLYNDNKSTNVGK